MRSGTVTHTSQTDRDLRAKAWPGSGTPRFADGILQWAMRHAHGRISAEMESEHSRCNEV